MESSREASVGSITRLIPGVRSGDELAVAELWRRYVFRVKGVAGPLMQNASPGAGDVDDVTQRRVQRVLRRRRRRTRRGARRQG